MVMGLMKPAVGHGDVHIEVDTTSGPKKLILRRVLHVPGLSESGITVTRLFSHHACYTGQEHGDPVFTYASKRGAITFSTFEVPLDHNHHRGLHTLHNNVLRTHAPAGNIALLAAERVFVALSSAVWHMRLGHISPARLKHMQLQAIGVDVKQTP